MSANGDTPERWIVIRHWRRFQHYDPAKRTPPWIKNQTELLHNHNYLELTGDQRSILHGLWLEYASSTCQLRLDTRSLTRRLNLRVTMRQLDRLVYKGFIEYALAPCEQHASPTRARVETETETETEGTPLPPIDTTAKFRPRDPNNLTSAEILELAHRLEAQGQ